MQVKIRGEKAVGSETEFQEKSIDIFDIEDEIASMQATGFKVKIIEQEVEPDSMGDYYRLQYETLLDMCKKWRSRNIDDKSLAGYLDSRCGA